MNIVFGSYLRDLEARENTKPLTDRRRVPTIEELAPEIGVHPVTLRNIANSNIKHLDLATAGKIVKTMRRLGFQMSETDLIRYKPE